MRRAPIAEHFNDVDKSHVVNSTLEMLWMMAVFGVMMVQSWFQFREFVLILFRAILKIRQPWRMFRKTLYSRRFQFRPVMIDTASSQLVSKPTDDLSNFPQCAQWSQADIRLCSWTGAVHLTRYHLRIEFYKIRSRPPSLWRNYIILREKVQ